MTCGNCGSHIGEDEHRCRRCGRRPGDSLSAAVMTSGALAAQIAPVPHTLPENEIPPAAPLGRATQRGLFQDNIIPFPPAAAPRKRASRTGSKPAAKGSVRRAAPNQGTLDFLPSNPRPRTLSTTVESKIYCEAPVAARLHRVISSALDWAMVLIGYGLLLSAYALAGGRIEFTKPGIYALAGTLALTGFTYGIFWAIAGCETAGMQWTRLRLLTFEGSRPERKERMVRFFGSCLSVCTVLGLIWSLGDEETLAWQDHISRTFCTPIEFENQVFRRG